MALTLYRQPSHWLALASTTAHHCRGRLLLGLLLVLATLAYWQPQRMADAFFTPDQQGQILFRLGRYDQAASRFHNEQWRAFSLYASGQFKAAAGLWSRQDSWQDRFAEANALTHAKQYYRAREGYRQVLRANSKLGAARVNIEVVEALIEEMEQNSSHSKPGNREASVAPDVSQAEKQPQGQQPEPGQGEKSDKDALGASGKPKQAWLNQVKQDPTHFLRRKFQLEYRQATQQEAKHD